MRVREQGGQEPEVGLKKLVRNLAAIIAGLNVAPGAEPVVFVEGRQGFQREQQSTETCLM